ncbi:MAG: 6,7-dimethyl-8-ribityllumazine synthase [Caulobacterales bacterium]|jgi:6,7-dimethyl-8-ribityllumazine synthase
METKDQSPPASVPGARILLVAAPYYRAVTDMMAQSAARWLQAAGATTDRIDVPGAFEIPAAIALQAASQRGFDGYVALGCVVRGETSHYDYVCGETARALMDLSVQRGLAIGYGILTVESLAQAQERADPTKRDKGAEVARAVAAIIAMKRALGQDTSQ